MLEEESEPIVCFNCEAEFVVHTLYEQEEQVNFCPFCGSEVEGEEDDIDDDDEADDYDSLVYR
jgi:hypothetical protein